MHGGCTQKVYIGCADGHVCRDDDCGRFCSLPTFHHTTPPFAGLGLRSFLVSDLSESLTSLIKKEGMSKTLIKKYKKRTKNTILQCNQFFLSESLIYHKRSEQITLLTWATWGIRSQSLICPERIAYCCSFDLSNLSKWANSQLWTFAHCCCHTSCIAAHGGPTYRASWVGSYTHFLCSLPF